MRIIEYVKKNCCVLALILVVAVLYHEVKIASPYRSNSVERSTEDVSESDVSSSGIRSTYRSMMLSSREYYSYYLGKKYVSAISIRRILELGPHDLERESLPLTPTEAIYQARSMLSREFPHLGGLVVEQVSIDAVTSGGYYVYVVSLKESLRSFQQGLNVVVLLDGFAVQPVETASDDSP